MNDCIFCRIANKEISCYPLYEDSDTLAFLDIHPHAQGHAVVIPRLHGQTVFDLPDTALPALLLTTKRVMEKLRDTLTPDGFSVGWNHGAAAGQAVPHLHIHILPRWKIDGGGSLHSIVNQPGARSVAEVAKLFQQ